MGVELGHWVFLRDDGGPSAGCADRRKRR
jgi:hypothetical protein